MEEIRIKDREKPNSVVEIKDGWEFPCYGINNDRDSIVYFTDYTKGTRIASSVGNTDIGLECHSWNMEHFEPIPKGKTIEIDT